MISYKFSHFDKVFAGHFWTKCAFRHSEMIDLLKIGRASSKKRLFFLKVGTVYMHLFFYWFFQRFLFHTLLKPLKTMMDAPSLYRRLYRVLVSTFHKYCRSAECNKPNFHSTEWRPLRKLFMTPCNNIFKKYASIGLFRAMYIHGINLSAFITMLLPVSPTDQPPAPLAGATACLGIGAITRLYRDSRESHY